MTPHGVAESHRSSGHKCSTPRRRCPRATSSAGAGFIQVGKRTDRVEVDVSVDADGGDPAGGREQRDEGTLADRPSPHRHTRLPTAPRSCGARCYVRGVCVHQIPIIWWSVGQPPHLTLTWCPGLRAGFPGRQWTVMVIFFMTMAPLALAGRSALATWGNS